MINVTNNAIWIVAGWGERDHAQVNKILPRIRDVANNILSDIIFCNIIKSNNLDSNKGLPKGLLDYVINFNIKDASVNDQVDFLSELFNINKPRVVIMLESAFSKIISSKLAIKLKLGVIADCIDISFGNKNEIEAIRTASSSTLVAKIGFINCDYGIMIVKRNMFVECDKKYKIYQSKIFNIEIKHKDLGSNDNLMLCNEEDNLYSINKRLIFVAGMGLKNKENVDNLVELAKKYNADIGATRAIVEAGFLPYKYQIGQSGSSASNEICITFGVSGAIQHICGIKNVDTIIAINNDYNAEIYKYADYKIIADANLIIEEMLERKII